VSQAIVQGPRSKDKVISRRPRTKATGRNCSLAAGGGERVDMLTTPYLPRDFAGARIDKRVAGGHASGRLVARLWIEE
jgi:hypothetical protein